MKNQKRGDFLEGSTTRQVDERRKRTNLLRSETAKKTLMNELNRETGLKRRKEQGRGGGLILSEIQMKERTKKGGEDKRELISDQGRQDTQVEKFNVKEELY